MVFFQKYIYIYVSPPRDKTLSLYICTYISLLLKQQQVQKQTCYPDVSSISLSVIISSGLLGKGGAWTPFKLLRSSACIFCFLLVQAIYTTRADAGTISVAPYSRRCNPSCTFPGASYSDGRIQNAAFMAARRAKLMMDITASVPAIRCAERATFGSCERHCTAWSEKLRTIPAAENPKEAKTEEMSRMPLTPSLASFLCVMDRNTILSSEIPRAAARNEKNSTRLQCKNRGKKRG